MVIKSLKKIPPVVFIIVGLLIAFGFPQFVNLIKNDEVNTNAPVTIKQSTPNRFSQGENLLILENATEEKQKGIESFADKNYPEAIALFEESLSQNPNDPETLIYLNNAQIGNNKAYSIAVPVPITSEENTAEEILRGVAQAQTEMNQQGGINNFPLKVLIVNDNNDPEVAQKVAQELANNQSILGVVGHFSSGVTLATAPIYEQNKLVAISPTSTAIAIANEGDYIFRTVPSDRFTSSALAKYFLEQLKLRDAAIIYNSQSSYSKSLQETFTTEVDSNGGSVVMEVDLSANNFNPAETLKTAQERGAEALVFLNDSTTVDKAYLLMQLNNRKLPLLGGDSLYNPQTLQIAGEKAVELAIAVPWHASGSPNPNFPTEARRLWGGDVNWRTAMAYDATEVLAAGLAENPSRSGIQAALSQSSFKVEGASGTIKFLPSGDRIIKSVLVKMKASPGKGYYFELLSTQ